jgi:hypothetical protein
MAQPLRAADARRRARLTLTVRQCPLLADFRQTKVRFRPKADIFISLNPVTLRRLIAGLLIAAWVPQVVGMWPGPTGVTRESVRQQFGDAIELSKQFPESEKTLADRKQFQAFVGDPDLLISDLWLSWGKHFALILAGVCAALMSWQKVRAWRWLVLGTSLAYFWLFSWPTSLKLISDYASSFSEAVIFFGIYLKSPIFVHNNFVVPILLLLALVLTVVEVSLSRRQQVISNREVNSNSPRAPVG